MAKLRSSNFLITWVKRGKITSEMKQGGAIRFPRRPNALIIIVRILNKRWPRGVAELCNWTREHVTLTRLIRFHGCNRAQAGFDERSQCKLSRVIGGVTQGEGGYVKQSSSCLLPHESWILIIEDGNFVTYISVILDFAKFDGSFSLIFGISHFGLYQSLNLQRKNLQFRIFCVDFGNFWTFQFDRILFVWFLYFFLISAAFHSRFFQPLNLQRKNFQFRIFCVDFCDSWTSQSRILFVWFLYFFLISGTSHFGFFQTLSFQRKNFQFRIFCVDFCDFWTFQFNTILFVWFLYLFLISGASHSGLFQTLNLQRKFPILDLLRRLLWFLNFPIQHNSFCVVFLFFLISGTLHSGLSQPLNF